MSVFDLYKPFRNKTALLSYDDSFYVTWALSQYLQMKNFKLPKDIEIHPEFLTHQVPQKLISEWELELLTKEVILNGKTVSTRGRTLRTWNTLSEAVNTLKHLENDIYALYGSADKILIELIRIAHRQFLWQSNRPNTVSTIRYFKIFNQEPIIQICLDQLGLTVEEIYLFGMAFLGVFFRHPVLNIPFESDIKVFTDEKITKFLSFTCRTIAELKPLLKSEQRYDDKFAYTYNPLRTFPLIRMHFRGRDSIVCPLPTLLFWRITGGLYYELLDDRRFSNAFGDSFQSYVGQVIKRACPGEKIHLHAEQRYGTKKARKDSVDWIISGDRYAIFLECKARRFSWSAKAALEDSGPLEVDIENMSSAVVQVYKTIHDYFDGQYPHFRFVAGRRIYPVIVSLENWHVLGDAMLGRLQDAAAQALNTAGLPEDYLTQMPYSVCAIEELEVAMQIMNLVGGDTFLDGKIHDSEMKWWDWSAYMRNCFSEYPPAKDLFANEFDEIFSGIAS